MVRHLLCIVVFVIPFQLCSQTGIGTVTPDPSAKLEVSSSNKGFLPPRVTLNSVTDNTTISNPVEGLLVYNKGSVGLQAGYYYWNGVNWATIATATSAGNGVTASDLVKIYNASFSTTATINTTGATFSVTTSGRYAIDFSSTSFAASMTFSVRNGTQVLASDMQTSVNNSVHVEYNGKLEVNLQAGVTYNVLVAYSNGYRDAGDYDRVYIKQVAGNLPVTGQSVDYVSVYRNSVQVVNTGDNILFNTINGGNVPYNTTNGNFTLSAGKTYRLTGSVSLDGSNGSNAEIDIAWRNATGDLFGNRALIISTSYPSTATGNGVTDIFYTPTVNTTVALYVTYATTNARTATNFTYANVEQVGSSAFVNPWILSGNDVYNTTGKVGIGTNTPSTKLDVAGDVNVTGNLNVAAGSSNVNISTNALTVGNSSGDEGGEIQFAKAATNTTLTNKVIIDVFRNQLRLWEGGTSSKGVSIDLSKAPDGVGGELVWKKSGIFNEGVPITLDNIKIQMSTSTTRSLQIASVSGSFTAMAAGAASYDNGTTSQAATAFSDGSITVTTSFSNLYSWSFPRAAASGWYHVLDTSNNRFYRIDFMVGASYNNNFISIERLY